MRIAEFGKKLSCMTVLCGLLGTGMVWADGENSPSASDAAGSKASSSGFSFSGLFNIFKGKGDDAPLIAEIKPGAYEPSSLALGGEKDLAQKRGNGFIFMPNQDIETYLLSVRKRLEIASGVTSIPGKVIVRATESFDSSATPDGNIFIGMGWLLFAENEDEIAAVIAHELSHILLTHFNADIISNVQDRTNSLGEIGVGVKMMLDKSKTLEGGNKEILQQLQLAKEIADIVVMPAWGRKQEREADLLGIDLLAKAGYSPAAMATMLEKLKRAEDNLNTEAKFQAHLSEVAKQNIGQAFSEIFFRMISTLKAQHPPTADRIKDTGNYIAKYYENEAMERGFNEKGWRTAASRGSAAEVLRNYDRAFSASKSLEKNQVDDALVYAKKAVSGTTKNHAYPNWVLGRAALAKGDYATAKNAYQAALRSDDVIKPVYDDMIDMEAKRGNYAAAIRLSDEAQQRFGDSPELYPRKIMLLRKANKHKEASDLAMRCTLDAPGMRRHCQTANTSTL